MTRAEQFEILENMFTWEVNEVGHFTIAFIAHYHQLDAMLEKCAKQFKTIGIPRQDYLSYTEDIYIIYSELCITTECLLKSLLEDSGYSESEIRKSGHNLGKLLDELNKIDTEKVSEIREKLKLCQDVLDYIVDNNIFIDTRYMTYKDDVSLNHIGKIIGLIKVLDLIYEKHYAGFNWLEILYPDSM